MSQTAESRARRTYPVVEDPSSASGRRSLPCLCLVYGAPEQVLRIDGGGKLVFGRDGEAGANVPLEDPSVSRLHAEVDRIAGGAALALRDLGSSNGTRLNGRRVNVTPMMPGDVLRMGCTLFVVSSVFEDEEGSEGEDSLGLVGTAPSIVEMRRVLRRVAPGDLSVLIIGLTGTGKELVAAAIHAASRRPGELVALNCAALPATLAESALFGHRKGAFTGATQDHEGAFVRADRGTLFLDEIGEMPREVQAKLLRVLETGEVTKLGGVEPRRVAVRVVAATNAPLDRSIADGSFREDLYGRLAGIVLRPPTLSERREDILPLLRHFLGDAAARPMTPDFAEALLLHGWPRNVRELGKLAERLLLLYPDAERWERAMLDGELGDGHAAREASAEAPPADDDAPEAPPEAAAAASGPPPSALTGPPDRESLIRLLHECGGNVSELARRVGRSRKQVYRWMERCELRPGEDR